MKEVKVFIRVPGEFETLVEAFRAIEVAVGYPVEVSMDRDRFPLVESREGFFVEGDFSRGSQPVVFSLVEWAESYREIGRETYEVEAESGLLDEEYPVYEVYREKDVTDWVVFYES